MRWQSKENFKAFGPIFKCCPNCPLYISSCLGRQTRFGQLNYAPPPREFFVTPLDEAILVEFLPSLNNLYLNPDYIGVRMQIFAGEEVVEDIFVGDINTGKERLISSPLWLKNITNVIYSGSANNGNLYFISSDGQINLGYYDFSTRRWRDSGISSETPVRLALTTFGNNISFGPDDTLVLTFDEGKTLTIFPPNIDWINQNAYVDEFGQTFFDAELKNFTFLIDSFDYSVYYRKSQAIITGLDNNIPHKVRIYNVNKQYNLSQIYIESDIIFPKQENIIYNEVLFSAVRALKNSAELTWSALEDEYLAGFIIDISENNGPWVPILTT